MWASHNTQTMLVRVVGTIILEEKLTDTFDEPCNIINILILTAGKLWVCCHAFQVDCDLDKVLNSSDSTPCHITYLPGYN
jgi:hypothetical protein